MEETGIELTFKEKEGEKIDFGLMEKKIEEVLKNNGNVAVFGSVGSGKTTILKALMKKSSELGIAKNVFLYGIDEVSREEMRTTNLLKIKKEEIKPKEIMKILEVFEAERLFLEEENNELDEGIIKGCIQLGMPICFSTYAQNIKMYEFIHKEMDLGKMDLIIHAKRSVDKRYCIFYNEKFEKIKFF